MDVRTARIYAAQADEWIARRGLVASDAHRLAVFARRIRRGGTVADLGCGPGVYAARLRARDFAVVALDGSAAMLAAATAHAPDTLRAQGDLGALPLRPLCLDGAWARNSYQHVPADELGLALAQLHRALRPGAPLYLTLTDMRQLDPTPQQLARGDVDHRAGRRADLPGRLFAAYTPARVRALLSGAGFGATTIRKHHRHFWLTVWARRLRTLPDLIRPGLQLLVCGLNPSLYSADAGVPFARPGNRFWPAATQAKLVAHRDPMHALARGVGFTDLVKRATPSADALTFREYAAGLQRVEALVRRYRPAVTCFVGLEGWRRTVDRHADAGWVAAGFGGSAAYLMPSTSGRNAHTPLAALMQHLRRAYAGP